jgi:predicted NUDIX family NTP pyrophosphohydrolase
MSTARVSAGILLYRRRPDVVEVLLAHPGGPFFARKDEGAWSIPKGLYEPAVDPDPLAAAVREFTEEVGSPPPYGPYLELEAVRLAGGKRVLAWAVEGDLDPATSTSNTFELEYPRGSGRLRTYPEIDRVEWFSFIDGRLKINPGQAPLLDQLAAALAA